MTSVNDFFRKCILNKSLKKFNNLEINRKDYSDKFSVLARDLNKKDLILTTSNLIQSIADYHKINLKMDFEKTKIFLSCIMIKHHPQVILSDESEIEIKIKKNSEYLLNKLIRINIYDNNIFSFNLYTYLFIKKFQNFILLFNEWKNQDKLKILNDLHTIYFELEADKKKRSQEDNPNQEVFINDISREQKRIIQKIKHIGGEEGLKNFENLKKQIDNYSQAVEKNYETINNIIHKAFWDNIRDKLASEPPDMLVLIPLLDDLKKMLKGCVPTRKDIHDQLNTNIDTEHIEDMIKHNAIDNRFITTIVYYIFNFIETFQSSSDDKETKEFKEDIMKRLSEGMFYKDFFPEFFKFIFVKVENILKEAEFIKNSNIYDKIKIMHQNRKK